MTFVSVLEVIVSMITRVTMAKAACVFGIDKKCLEIV